MQKSTHKKSLLHSEKRGGRSGDIIFLNQKLTEKLAPLIVFFLSIFWYLLVIMYKYLLEPI